MYILLATILGANAMAPAPFSILKEQIDEASFSSEQLTIISGASRYNQFTSLQINELLEEISFSDNQLDALRILAPTISDHEN